MFQAIITKNRRQLEKLGRDFFYSNNTPAALLCLDHVFNTPFKFYGLSIQGKATCLDTFCAYIKLLRDVAITQDPCRNRLVQKLFSVQSLREDAFTLPRGTLLHNAVANRDVPYFTGQGQRTVLNANLTRTFRSSLSEHIRKRVMEESEVFQDADFLLPCLNLASSCDRADCSRAHVAGDTLGTTHGCRCTFNKF